MLTVSEQGLYFFLGRSDKPAALPFQKWLAGEVLPSIRKTGSYVLPGVQDVTPVPRSFLSPENLPLDIFTIPTPTRLRCLSLTLQALRLVGANSGQEIVDCFVDCCRSMHQRACLPGGSADSRNTAQIVEDFVQEACIFGPYQCRARELYEAFGQWCALAGLGKNRRGSIKSFSRTLAETAGVRVARQRPFMLFEGLRLDVDWRQRSALTVKEARHA